MNTSDAPQSLAVVDVEKVRDIAKVSENFLHDMFTGFRDHYADAATTIRKFLDAGEQKDAKILAHSIVGISGSLGAEQVYAAATNLDRALVQGHMAAVEQAFPDFQESLARLIDYIDDQYPTHTVV